MRTDQHVKKGRILGKERSFIECSDVIRGFRANREELSEIQ